MALAPLLWLSALDHAAARTFLRSSVAHHETDAARTTREPELSGRLFRAAAGATIFCTVLYALMTSIGVARAFEPDLTTAALAAGVLWSFAEHAVVFSTAFLVLAVAMAIARRTAQPLLVGYGALSLLLTMIFATALRATRRDADRTRAAVAVGGGKRSRL